MRQKQIETRRMKTEKNNAQIENIHIEKEGFKVYNPFSINLVRNFSIKEKLPLREYFCRTI